MPSSSQPYRSNAPSPRRLLSPEERFGLGTSPDPNPPASQENVSVENTPLIANVSSPVDTRRSAGRKARHERHRFDRQEHRHQAHRVERKPLEAQRRPEFAFKHPGGEDGEEHEMPEALPPSPTLLRIRAARKRFWRRLALVSSALGVAVSSWALLFAPQFNIERVEIVGLHETSPQQVTPLARMVLGRNALRAPKAALAHRLEHLPTVASARVVLRPSFPPTALVQVRERVPTLRLGDGTSWWVVDSDGVPYRSATPGDAALPSLTWKRPVQTLKRLDETSWDDARQLVSALGSLQGDKSLPPVREALLDGSGDATLVLGQGTQTLRVQLGNDAWPAKARRARVALRYFQRTGRVAQELNLVSLRLPRWTPRGASASSASATSASPSAPV